MRRAFQIALLSVAFLPLALGAMTLVDGAARFVSEDTVTARLDSQMRFSAVRSMLPFVLAIWIVRNLERAGTVLLLVLAATAFGGVARVVSAMEYGLPEPFSIGIILLEIGVLAFIPWYRAVTGPADRVPFGA